MFSLQSYANTLRSFISVQSGQELKTQSVSSPPLSRHLSRTELERLRRIENVHDQVNRIRNAGRASGMIQVASFPFFKRSQQGFRHYTRILEEQERRRRMADLRERDWKRAAASTLARAFETAEEARRMASHQEAAEEPDALLTSSRSSLSHSMVINNDFDELAGGAVSPLLLDPHDQDDFLHQLDLDCVREWNTEPVCLESPSSVVPTTQVNTAANEYEGHALDLAARMAHAMSSMLRFSQEISRSIDVATLEEDERLRRITDADEQERERAHCHILSEALRIRLMELKQAAQQTQQAVSEILDLGGKSWTAQEVALLEEQERLRRVEDLEEQRVAVKNGLHVSRLLLHTLSAMKEEIAKRRETMATQHTQYSYEKTRKPFQPSPLKRSSSVSDAIEAIPAAGAGAF